jgi:excinuclease ABC subunit C
MGRCAAPCVGRIAVEEYAELVQGTELFLRGRSAELLELLSSRMQEAARAERFEEAARLRDRIAAVEATVERQQIVSERPVDRDVFGLARDGGEVEVQVLHVREGRVVGSDQFGFSDVRLDDGEVVGSFLGQYYAGDAERPVPGEILTDVAVHDDGALEAWLAERAGRRVAVRAARRGSGRDLVELAGRNAELSLRARLEARESVAAAADELRERLALARAPRRIECYDVSNLGGTLAVGSRVVFEDGQACRADYRRYRIREAAAGDDLACMREVMRRRLAHIEREPLPDLILVDGGRGQLGVVSALLRDAGLAADHAGLAKERDPASERPRVRRSGGLKAEKIFVPGRKDPVLLPPSSRGLLLLQRVRDEAHRFAIEFQRALRRKVGMTSILEELPGVGPGKRRALLRHLGSLRAVREASLETLASVPGLSARDAGTVHGFFRALEAGSAETDAGVEGEGAGEAPEGAGEAGGTPSPVA